MRVTAAASELVSKGSPTCLAAIIAVICLGSCAPDPDPADVVIEGVSVYSGTRDEPFVADVVIRGGIIQSVAPDGGRRIPAIDRVDGRDQYLVPGLWDVHTHVRSSRDGGLDVTEFLAHGVTSVRDLGGVIERIQSVVADIEQRVIAGPAILSVFTMLNGESFAPFQQAVNSEGDVSRAIDELAIDGAVQVKIHRALSPEMLPVVLRAAHRRELQVIGHIPLGVHPLDACREGMDGIEHVGSLVEALVSVDPYSDGDSSRAIDYLLSDASEPLYRCLADRGVPVTPTLVVYPEVARRRVGGGEFPPEYVDFIEAMLRIVKKMHESGVTLLAGTDTSDYSGPPRLGPGESLHDELVMMQDAGILPTAIIAIATTNAARALGIEARTGSVEQGKAADFVLLGSDPGADIRNMRDIVAVYQAGRQVAGGPLR